MKLSVFYNHIEEASQQENISEDEILKRAKDFGIDFCEIDFSQIENNDEILNKISKANLKVSSVYCFYDFNLRNENEKIKNHIRRAKDCDSKNIMIIPGFFQTQNDNEEKIFIDGTRVVCQEACKKNIQPLIEDFDNYKSPIAKMEQLKNYVDKIPELRIAFDTGNFMYSNQNEMDAYRLLKNKITHVHCKDRSLTKNNGDESTCLDGTKMYPAPVGFGDIKMKEIVSDLLKSGYDRIFTIEHFGSKNQLEYMKKSAEFLLSIKK